MDITARGPASPAHRGVGMWAMEVPGAVAASPAPRAPLVPEGGALPGSGLSSPARPGEGARGQDILRVAAAGDSRPRRALGTPS